MQVVDLFYATDDEGIWFAAWLDIGVLDGVGMSLWIRQDKRQSRRAFRYIFDAMRHGFTKGPVLVVVTNQPAIEELHHKIGFTPLGHIPMVYNGKTARVSYLTVDTFHELDTEYAGRGRDMNGHG